MIRVITYGLIVQYNLGCPSILHGIHALLRDVYGDEFEMVNLQIGAFPPDAVADMDFQTISIQPFRGKDFIKAYFLRQKLSTPGAVSLSDAFEMIKCADIVIDLLGICFCDNLQTNEASPVPTWLKTMLRFPLSCAAKRYHVRSIKNTASYGPAHYKSNQRAARFAYLHLFDCVVAREEKSREALQALGITETTLLSPDTANLMPVTRIETFQRPTVGISTSHQIVRQWKSAEDYVSCIAKLCRHILQMYDVDILLIPNECDPKAIYNDIDVSEDILSILQESGAEAEILNVQSMTATDIKNKIAACEVLVASRYHSCVAALSSGVPLMVIGWHYKYEELLRLYGQEKWLLSEAECDAEKLAAMFDGLWKERDLRRKEINACIPTVKNAVREVGRQMLGVDKRRKA